MDFLTLGVSLRIGGVAEQWPRAAFAVSLTGRIGGIFWGGRCGMTTTAKIGFNGRLHDPLNLS